VAGAKQSPRGAPSTADGREAHQPAAPSRAGRREGRALHGTRVLDLTSVLAGPFCAYQLAMLGADVIKIERPAVGDLARQLGADPSLNQKLMGASFLAQNAGKRSVTINLKSQAGKRLFLELVEDADVVVENFRPGVMEHHLGLGYEALRKVNPSLVYCAISGYGQDGPLSAAPAYDQIVQGMSGVMSISGDAESAPLRVGYPVADTIGGLTAALAITSALLRRLRTGEGTFVDVSMLDSTLVTMGWVVSNYLIAEHTPLPMGNDNFTAAPSGTFKTGRGLLNIAANRQEQFEVLARVLGVPHLVEDPRYADREDRRRNRAALNDEIEAGLHTRSAEEWEALLNASGVPAGRVLTVPEVLRHPQVVHRRLVKTFEAAPGVDRSIAMTLAGFKMSGADPDVDVPPPALGEHTDEVLAELGYSAADIDALRSAGAV
jgi:CoA:oxalate CoA-transferase